MTATVFNRFAKALPEDRAAAWRDKPRVVTINGSRETPSTAKLDHVPEGLRAGKIGPTRPCYACFPLFDVCTLSVAAGRPLDVRHLLPLSRWHLGILEPRQKDGFAYLGTYTDLSVYQREFDKSSAGRTRCRAASANKSCSSRALRLQNERWRSDRRPSNLVLCDALIESVPGYAVCMSCLRRGQCKG